jgi:hypothetical protein
MRTARPGPGSNCRVGKTEKVVKRRGFRAGSPEEEEFLERYRVGQIQPTLQLPFRGCRASIG